MQIPILTFPNKHLKEKSRAVEKVTGKITDFVQDLFATLYASDTGIGLAAPQVGENLNIFVMDVPLIDPNDPEKQTPNPIAFINPRITERAGTILYEEGCLSCPELIVEVERAKNISVLSLDKEGREQTHRLSDLAAVCVQHEMDHLIGRLLTDYISRLKRDLYRKQRVKVRGEDPSHPLAK